MNKVTIDRELLERLAGNGPTSTISATRELREILAAPRQPEGEGLEVVAWQDAENPLYTIAERRVLHDWANNGYPIVELCRLSDAQRAIAELRDRLDVMTQCADTYSLMFEESAEECDTLRQQLAEMRDMLSGEVETNIPLRQKAFDLTEQRDKLAEILRDIVPGCKWKHMRQRIDAALVEIDHDNE